MMKNNKSNILINRNMSTDILKRSEKVNEIKVIKEEINNIKEDK